MDGRSRNLRLYGRLSDVLDTDDHFAAAALAHRDAMDELAGIYSLRLQRALDSVYAVRAGPLAHDIADAAFDDAVRGGPRRSTPGTCAPSTSCTASSRPPRRPTSSEPIARHRGEVAELLRDAAVLAIAGGHVGILLRCLRLFAVVPSPELPVVAWSAGAMALTERVVLYNDRGPQGVPGRRGLGPRPRPGPRRRRDAPRAPPAADRRPRAARCSSAGSRRRTLPAARRRHPGRPRRRRRACRRRMPGC